MIKNFEAMACGCVLLAWDQGEAENEALGFVDMTNLVLYRSIDELRCKLALLRSDPELASRIAAAGRELAVREYSFSRIGQRIVRRWTNHYGNVARWDCWTGCCCAGGRGESVTYSLADSVFRTMAVLDAVFPADMQAERRYRLALFSDCGTPDDLPTTYRSFRFLLSTTASWSASV